MQSVIDTLGGSWPWYVAGPLIGLMVPILLLVGNRAFGVSSSLRHICAATLPAKPSYLRYDWKAESWNLLFVAGIVLGAFLGSRVLPNPEMVALAEATAADLEVLGISDRAGLVPPSLFAWSEVFSVEGFVAMIVGGFLVGFGARYAGGCTSGHGVMGLATFQLPSLVAVLGFFAGGLFITHVIFPVLFGGGR